MVEKPTILIIDDERHVRMAAVTVLEDNGFRTMQAEDGPSGLLALRASPPDGVLLDLRMPKMDGLDVLSVIVDELPELPVIVWSGLGTMTDAVEALRRGAWDFVTKPVLDVELLVHSIERGLEKARLRRQNREYRAHLEQANMVLADALGELRADQQGARLLQMHLLPRDGLAFAGYTLERRLFPSLILSGDFLDYFPIGPRNAGFYVADVSGHGAASAFVTAILTTLVAEYRQRYASGRERTILEPAELLGHLDRDLAALSLSQHVTMFYGVLDLDAQSLRFANAGLYPFPLLCDRSGVVGLEAAGRPLGLPGKAGFAVGERTFPRDARLLVTTDGVLELGPVCSYREKREELCGLLERSSCLSDVVAGLCIAEGVPLCDDIALLLIRGEASHAHA